jgi:hypothetical protein
MQAEAARAIAMKTEMSWQPFQPSRYCFCGNRGSLTTLALPGSSSGTSTTEILLCRSPFSSMRRHALPYSDSGSWDAV